MGIMGDVRLPQHRVMNLLVFVNSLEVQDYQNYSPQFGMIKIPY